MFNNIVDILNVDFSQHQFNNYRQGLCTSCKHALQFDYLLQLLTCIRTCVGFLSPQVCQICCAIASTVVTLCGMDGEHDRSIYIPDLLTAWCNGEGHLGLDASRQGLLGHT